MVNADSALPLVSIITPSFNHARYLPAAIASVLGQDYPLIEYRVIDGGSSDGTADLLRRYGARLQWLSEPDQGQADAVNKGLALASGEIIGWLNSDDEYAPGAIRAAVEFLVAHPEVDLVYGNAEFIDDAGRAIQPYYTEDFSAARLRECNLICQPAVFARAEVYRRCGPLDVSLRYAMDYDYWLRAAAGCRLAHLDRLLARWRLHGGTKSVTGRVTAAREAIEVVKRHARPVPFAHLYDLARLKIAARHLHGLEGVHGDGRAEPRISFLWRAAHPGRHQLTVRLANETITSLRLCLDDEEVAVRAAPPGELTLRFGFLARQTETPSRLTLYADRYAEPLPDDRRFLSYRLRELKVNAVGGRRETIYSPARAFFTRGLVTGEYCRLSLEHNHALPWKVFAEKLTGRFG